MKLNQTERRILLGVLADRDRNRKLDPIGSRPHWASDRTKELYKDAHEGIVPLRSGEWVGEVYVTGGLAVKVHRAFARLERLGLIRRHALYVETPGRTSHLQLLPDGEQAARRHSPQTRKEK